MGKLVNFVSKLHESTKRNYLDRMINQKVSCMKKARKFEYDYWDGKTVKTCFNREVPADKHHALNYIIQSTCADLILQKMIKICNILENKKSNMKTISPGFQKK